MNEFMKAYRCSVCGGKAFGFQSDIDSGNWDSVAFEKATCADGCTLKMVFSISSTVHGEAGWMVDETMLDSIGSIHDDESQRIREAEYERETKEYQKHVTTK